MSKIPGGPLRWFAISVFLFSSMLNYLDRQLLAAVAPSLRSEFNLSNHQYGQILSVFSIVYAVVAPAAGWFIDRVGLNAGVSIAVLVWSLAGASTGLTRSVSGLLASRTALGVAEAAGIPGFGKANSVYLAPSELALGTAFNQVGISLGLMAAPLIVAAVAPAYGWRSAFIICGALGLVWVPIWLLTAKWIPAKPIVKQQSQASISELLRDRRIWGLIFATLFLMSLYTLWTNWTTLYFVEQWHLTQEEANRRFAWLPPIFAVLGGFFGGWLAFRWIRRGVAVLTARIRVCWICAIGSLIATAIIPLMPNVVLAVGAICISSFWALSISTNLYSLPIDMLGPARAAFGVAILTFAYGLMQTFISPAIGYVVDHAGFTAVCFSMAALPMIGVWILQATAE
jgi:ACS family hexuronate transporter-like MFS transporter